jgi:putative ABC transport system permease protein
MDRATRWFRRLLRMLPADFQADYARDMERTFRAQQAEARALGRRGLARLWCDTVLGMVRAAPRQHMDQIRQDVVYALRSLGRRPAAAAAAVTTLAIGIGSVTAIASIVNGIEWRPLPYPAPDRLVFVEERFKGEASATTGYSTFEDWRLRSDEFEELAAIGSSEATLATPGGAERVAGLRVTPGYFRVTGVAPALGRPFTAAENRPANRRFVILSARLWRARFNGDADIVGRAVQLNGVPYVVTGVMPEGVEDVLADRVYDRADVWLPLAYDVSLPFACRTCRHLRVIGRLKPHASIDRAQAELDAITQQLARENPTSYADPGANVRLAADVLLGPVRPALYLLLAAVCVLLIIATVNVANLLLVRAVERAPEIATRRALGVATGRLVRQLLTESGVLAAMGAAGGVAFAYAASSGLLALAPPTIPRLEQVTLDARVLGLTLLIAVAVAVLLGVLPAWHLAARDLTPLLRGGRALVPGGGRLGRALVAGNVALAVVLLAITGLLGRSFLALMRVEPGFDPESVTTASLSLAGPKYVERGASMAFYAALLDRIGGSGDVAALTTQLPTDPNDAAGFHVHGRLTANPEDAPMADRFGVTPSYFRALRIPVLRGRGFTDRDRAHAPRVAIVNKTAADRLFQGEDPIGQRISLGGPADPPRVIVGIVGDVRHRGLGEPVSYQAYVPLEQFDDWPVRILLRTRDSHAAAAERIRQAVAALDRSQVVVAVRPYDALVRETLADRRFLLWLIGGFAAAALLLASIGLYGVVSYVVAQRGRDLALRMALGAARADIRVLVLRMGMTPVALGVAVGLALAIAATRLVDPMLFAVGRFDAAALGGAVVALCASAGVACYLPARRATRLDPIAALRTD